MFSIKKKVPTTKNVAKNAVINPQIIKNIYCLPDSPPYIHQGQLNKISNLYVLKKIEYQYDEFLNKKYHLLLLLNLMEEALETRDVITNAINRLKRKTYPNTFSLVY